MVYLSHRHPYIMIMLGNLYSTDILSLSSTLENASLEQPDGTSRRVSKLCGSWVELDVIMAGDKVAEAALQVQACALGQACAAILKERIVGATLTELIEARDSLKAMLKDDGAVPTGRFERLCLLEGVRAYPARHQSTMLAFEAAVEAIERGLKRED